MICPKCEIEMNKVKGNYHFTECGLDNVYLKDTMFKCSECGLELALFPNPEEFIPALTKFLVRQKERLNGSQILFLRRAMGLTGSALADFLGKSRMEVSRWENGRAFISPHLDMKFRSEVAKKLLSEQEAREVEVALGDIFLHRYEETTMTQKITLTRSWSVVVPELAVPA
jgi:HTH-type transcriptional regulator, competence development regulator